jgi:CheY-like chemotaxis protein/HPt (histidine-containing phosphotransfer) domain-containing protein
MKSNDKEAKTEPATAENPAEMQILLVEDAAENRLLIRAFLNKTPYHIDVAENGEIAVQKFTSKAYGLVLMDMQMPVMDGYAATESIRNWEREKGLDVTPIIALSAYADEKDAQKSLDAGCSAHLTKPVRKTTLLEAIEGFTTKQGELMADEHMDKEANLNKQEKIIVRVDAEIQDLVPDFLKNRHRDIKTMEGALAQGDYQAIGALGHIMKGAGGGYGFDRVTDIGRRLENAAHEEDEMEIRKHIEELRNYIGKVEVIYE